MKIPTREEVEALTKSLTDDGKIVEAGWMALRLMAIPPDASELQVHEMRKAFYLGAQHLFASINSILDPGGEPTEKDLARMTLIFQELDTFEKNLRAEAARRPS